MSKSYHKVADNLRLRQCSLFSCPLLVLFQFPCNKFTLCFIIKVAELHKMILLTAMIFVIFAFHAITAIKLVRLHVFVDQLLLILFHSHDVRLKKTKQKTRGEFQSGRTMRQQSENPTLHVQNNKKCVSAKLPNKPIQMHIPFQSSLSKLSKYFNACILTRSVMF